MFLRTCVFPASSFASHDLHLQDVERSRPALCLTVAASRTVPVTCRVRHIRTRDKEFCVNEHS